MTFILNNLLHHSDACYTPHFLNKDDFFQIKLKEKTPLFCFVQNDDLCSCTLRVKKRPILPHHAISDFKEDIWHYIYIYIYICRTLSYICYIFLTYNDLNKCIFMNTFESYALCEVIFNSSLEARKWLYFPDFTLPTWLWSI